MDVSKYLHTEISVSVGGDLMFCGSIPEFSEAFFIPTSEEQVSDWADRESLDVDFNLKYLH